MCPVYDWLRGAADAPAKAVGDHLVSHMAWSVQQCISVACNTIRPDLCTMRTLLLQLCRMHGGHPSGGCSSITCSWWTPTVAYFSTLVTPGLAAESTTLRPSSLLISALLPMFGKPITHALTGRGARPRLLRLALIYSLTLSAARRTACMPAPALPSVQKT